MDAGLCARLLSFRFQCTASPRRTGHIPQGRRRGFCRFPDRKENAAARSSGNAFRVDETHLRLRVKRRCRSAPPARAGNPVPVSPGWLSVPKGRTSHDQSLRQSSLWQAPPLSARGSNLCFPDGCGGRSRSKGGRNAPATLLALRHVHAEPGPLAGQAGRDPFSSGRTGSALWWRLRFHRPHPVGLLNARPDSAPRIRRLWRGGGRWPSRSRAGRR